MHSRNQQDMYAQGNASQTSVSTASQYTNVGASLVGNKNSTPE